MSGDRRPSGARELRNIDRRGSAAGRRRRSRQAGGLGGQAWRRRGDVKARSVAEGDVDRAGRISRACREEPVQVEGRRRRT